MLLFVQALYQHIIYINFHISPNLWTKHMIHQPLISYPRILQPKGQHLVTKQTLASNERCLLLIYLVHPYLIVTWKGVHETQQFMTRSWVHQLINMWQWVAILWASLIQIGEVHSYSPFSISLPNHHHVSQPIRVINFLNKFHRSQLLDFFLNSIILLKSKDSFLLKVKLEGRMYI